ncbi:MAG: hypothetical protein QOJ11_567, partial [Frankiales bacterium]|nr:hypothetical protein [Frankiales bacterium]
TQPTSTHPTTTQPTTTQPTTTQTSASPTSSASTTSTPAPQPSVTVNPADYVGRPYNEVASALQQLGLTPSPTSVATTGDPGTVAGVDPAGVVKAGSTVTVQVVSGSVAPTGGGKGGGKSHKPPKGKETGGNGG